MSSSSQEDPLHRVELSPDQLELIFQIVHQLENFDAPRLNNQVQERARLDYLVATVNSIRDLLADASMIQIFTTTDKSEDSGQGQSFLATVQREDRLLTEVRAFLKEDMFDQLQSLTQFAVSSLGQRELFLRTGYHPSEIEDAIRALQGK
jgi:hypothetical protein